MERDRFWIIAGILFLIFIIFMGVVVLKADSLTHNACEICAKKMGSDITCSTNSGTKVISQTFWANWTEFKLGGS
jgi:uncharacterized membrane protein YhaH (DUF805 family)